MNPFWTFVWNTTVLMVLVGGCMEALDGHEKVGPWACGVLAVGAVLGMIWSLIRSGDGER